MPQSENRFVRGRCPICHLTSPVCDQVADIRRDIIREWWDAHLRVVHPRPGIIFEQAENPVVPVER